MAAYIAVVATIVGGVGIVAMCSVEDGVLLGLILWLFSIHFLVLGLVIIEARTIAIGVAVVAGVAIETVAARIVSVATIEDGIFLSLILVFFSVHFLTLGLVVIEARAVNAIGMAVVAAIGMGVVAVATVEDGVLFGFVVLGRSFNSVCHLTLLILGLVVIEARTIAIGVAVVAGMAIEAEAARVVAIATIEDGIFLGLVVLGTGLVVIEAMIGVIASIAGAEITGMTIVAEATRVVAITTIEDGVFLSFVVLSTFHLVVVEARVVVAVVAIGAVEARVVVTVVSTTVTTVENSVLIGLVLAISNLVVIEAMVEAAAVATIRMSDIAIATAVAIRMAVVAAMVAVARVVAITTIEDGILFGLVVLGTFTGLVVVEAVGVAVAVIATIGMAVIAGMAIEASVATIDDGIILGLVVLGRSFNSV